MTKIFRTCQLYPSTKWSRKMVTVVEMKSYAISRKTFFQFAILDLNVFNETGCVGKYIFGGHYVTFLSASTSNIQSRIKVHFVATFLNNFLIVFVRVLWNVDCISFDNLLKKYRNSFWLKMYTLIQNVAKFRSKCEKYKMDFYPELSFFLKKKNYLLLLGKLHRSQIWQAWQDLRCICKKACQICLSAGKSRNKYPFSKLFSSSFRKVVVLVLKNK